MLQRPKRWVESLRPVHYVFYRSNGTLACWWSNCQGLLLLRPRNWLAIPGVIWISHVPTVNGCCGGPAPRLRLEGHANVDTRRLTAAASSA